MSYQVLARKWRPQNFTELVGQEHVRQALTNALQANRLHHAYLFTGTRGVGKTTIARILAKSLNCEQGISAQPCGTCNACREISEGCFVDLIEVDAASKTKVEDTRDLLDNVQFAPTIGRFKVYLIDEVHMLSNHSFNALLKTLEEPPDHVKFLLATTDPQRLPVTILSRCLQFHLKRVEPEAIQQQLEHILTAENIEFENAALPPIAHAADGSLRDALSLLDQAIAYGAGQVREGEVRSMLGNIDRQGVLTLIKALLARDFDAMLAESKRLHQFSLDYKLVLGELISSLHQLALLQVAPDSFDNNDPFRHDWFEVSQAIAAEDLQVYYQIALQGQRDLPYCPDPKIGFEMTLLRLLHFRPFDTSVAQSSPAASAVKSAATATSPSSQANSAAMASATTHTAPQTASPAQALRESLKKKI
jgi:DNA polymerase III subunit gamma/tau